MSVFVPQMDDLSNRAAAQAAVAAVSARSQWNVGIPIAGTVGGLAAADDTLTPNAIFLAALADTAGSGIASTKCIQVPLNCTYLEIGAIGDNASIGTSPVIELWRSSHTNTSAGGGAGVAQAIPAGQKDWKRLYSVLGNAQATMAGTVQDQSAVAGVDRYTLDEGTYQNQLFDVRGARLIVVKVITIGTTGNWSLVYRFF